MIYLKVAHTNDNDADYFKFSKLGDAINYIVDEEIYEYVLSDIRFEEMPEDDYTYVEG